MNTSVAILVSGLYCLTFCSCFDAKEKQLIIGSWTGVEWESDGGSAYPPQSAAFTFDENRQYTYSFAGQTEKGTYFISNKQLYTTPEGGKKIMVRIDKLVQDTLIFAMNREGVLEKLTLVRN